MGRHRRTAAHRQLTCTPSACPKKEKDNRCASQMALTVNGAYAAGSMSRSSKHLTADLADAATKIVGYFPARGRGLPE